MNCLRFLKNNLSIFNNVRDCKSKLYGIRGFSSILETKLSNNTYSINAISKPFFKTNLNLTPVTGFLFQQCGMKVKGKLKLRCKHCYYAGIDGILHVFCDVYPRHKQRAMTARKKKYTWILTHACQSKYRPY